MILSKLEALAYNILKIFKDDLVEDMEIPELDPCSECNNDLFSYSLKAFTDLPHLAMDMCFIEVVLRKNLQ